MQTNQVTANKKRNKNGSALSTNLKKEQKYIHLFLKSLK